MCFAANVRPTVDDVIMNDHVNVYVHVIVI